MDEWLVYCSVYIDCNALEKSSHCLNLTHFLLTSMLTCPCNQLYKPNPGDSAGKESTYNVRYLGSIPGLGRSPGERIGYPLQCSWASLVAQMAKNQPTVQETWVWSLDWEDPLEEGMAAHSSILAWRIPWTEERGGLQCMGWQRVRQMTEGLSTAQHNLLEKWDDRNPGIFTETRDADMQFFFTFWGLAFLLSLVHRSVPLQPQSS